MRGVGAFVFREVKTSMSQELTNEVQRTPSEIVRDMTGGTQIFHPETSVTEEKTNETLRPTAESVAVQLGPNPPQPVPLQSDFIPDVGTWWEFVDHDKGLVFFLVGLNAGNGLAVAEQFTVLVENDNRVRFVGRQIYDISLTDFRSGILVAIPEEHSIDLLVLRRDYLFGNLPDKEYQKPKRDVNYSDPERPATLVDDIVRAIADELSVDSKHVNRLLESALEGVRNFVTLKNCVSTSPAIPAFLSVLKSPQIGELIRAVLLPSIAGIVRNIAAEESERAARIFRAEHDAQIDSLKKELVARRQWESEFDVFANVTREDINRLIKRFEEIEKAFEEIPSVDLAAMKDLTPTNLVDSRINPQMNKVREQIANLFERCDNIERQRLRDKQKKWTKERIKKEERAAKVTERREHVNQASKTLQERKRREKVGDELLSRGIVAPVTPTAQVKRGRGRPPKTAVPEVKRGRGRPRKSA